MKEYEKFNSIISNFYEKNIHFFKEMFENTLKSFKHFSEFKSIEHKIQKVNYGGYNDNARMEILFVANYDNISKNWIGCKSKLEQHFLLFQDLCPYSYNPEKCSRTNFESFPEWVFFQRYSVNTDKNKFYFSWTFNFFKPMSNEEMMRIIKKYYPVVFSKA